MSPNIKVAICLCFLTIALMGAASTADFALPAPFSQLAALDLALLAGITNGILLCRAFPSLTVRL